MFTYFSRNHLSPIVIKLKLASKSQSPGVFVWFWVWLFFFPAAFSSILLGRVFFEMLQIFPKCDSIRSESIRSLKSFSAATADFSEVDLDFWKSASQKQAVLAPLYSLAVR